MEYLKFYNLDEDPFRFRPDPGSFFRSEGHSKVLQSLDSLIDNRNEMFMLVTGETGIGKTLTLKVFFEKCKNENKTAIMITPGLSPEEFFLAVLDALDVPRPAGGKNEFIKAFREFLLSNGAEGNKTVIMVDDAQQLPDETLEELQLLPTLETNEVKLLQIILIGMTGLKDRLRQNRFRQLDQLITVRSELHPFTRSETFEYISFRLDRAGKGMTVFDERAKRAIHNLTLGVPRTINLLASRSLMSAFIEESRTVGERHVRQAASHVFYSPPGSEPWTVFNPIRRFFGESVEDKPVIVDKNLPTPRPTRPPGRLRPAGVAVIVAGAVVAGGMYMAGSGVGPAGGGRQVPAPPAVIDAAKSARAATSTAAQPAVPAPASSAAPRPGNKAVLNATDNRKKPAARLSGLLSDLPEFVPRVTQDRSYAARNPGWERYRGKANEYRVYREKTGYIKGIQVIDRGGDGVDEEFMKRALQQVAGTPAFKAESTELKEGFRIERGKVAEKLQAVCYRDENGGKLRAFVLTWL